MNKILLGSLVAFGFLVGGTAVANADTVTVQSGNTVSQIAKDHGTTVDSIQQLNHLADINKIYVGDTIQVNTQGNNQATVPTTVSKTTIEVSQPSKNTADTVSNILVSREEQAKETIAIRESGGSYTAQNGKYIGRYQLDSSYLHGDNSPANQERVAQQYISQRYGSWTNALQHENSFGWY